jgi:hypothetical protein
MTLASDGNLCCGLKTAEIVHRSGEHIGHLSQGDILRRTPRSIIKRFDHSFDLTERVHSTEWRQRNGLSGHEEILAWIGQTTPRDIDPAVVFRQ